MHVEIKILKVEILNKFFILPDSLLATTCFVTSKGTGIENRNLSRYNIGEAIDELLLSNASNLIYVRTASKVVQVSTLTLTFKKRLISVYQQIFGFV